MSSIGSRCCSRFRSCFHSRLHTRIPSRWLVFVGAVAVFLSVAASLPACSTQLLTRAFVEVVDAPRLRELAPMQFGSVLRPTSGVNSVRLSPGGDRQLQGEGNAELMDGPANGAQLAIQAARGQTILVRARLADGGGENLGLQDIVGRYNDGAETPLGEDHAAAFAATAEGVLSLGARLTGLTRAVSPGVHEFTIAVEVDYQ